MAPIPSPVPPAYVGRLLSWLVPDEGAIGSVHWWRGRLLASVLLACAVAEVLAFVPSISLAIREGAWTVVVFDVAAFTVFNGLLVARRVSRTTRTWVLLFSLWAIGTFFSWGWGGELAGPLYLMAVPMLAGVLLGVRSTIAALALSTLSAILVWAGIVRAVVPWAGPPLAPLPTPDALGVWVIVATNMLFLATIGAVGAAVLARGLAAQGAARERAEAELLSVGRALEQSDDLVLLVRADGVVVRANTPEHSGDDAPGLGQSIARFGLRPTGDPAAEFPWREAFAGHAWTGRCARGEGEATRWYEATLRPVREADEPITLALIVLREVTEQLALRERLRTSAKLEAVGTLVGGIAHDFNNLLQPVLGNTEEVRRLLPPGHVALPLLEDITASATRGRNLVRRILTFSRGVEVPREPTPLAEVVEEALRLSDVPRAPDIALDVSVATDAWVLADPAELHHVVVNLLTNARDAMPSGGRLSIRADVERPSAGAAVEQAFAVLTVRDTGCGMDDETRRRVFEPFFSTKPPGRGTGLGLSMVHGTVQSLGGSVDIQSMVGVGTSVIIRLPVVDASRDEAAATAEATAVAASAPAASLTGRILVVDDVDSVRLTTVRLLTRAGFTTRDVADPREAVQIVAADPTGFDVVLTDLSMPHMSGAALARTLRATAPHVPVVLMTGMLDADDAEAARGDGVVAVLAKPFSHRELIDAIRVARTAVPGRVSGA